MKIDSPKEIYHLRFQAPSAQWPTSVAFLGERRVAAANREGTILVWDLPENPPEPEKDADKEGGPDVPPALQLVGHTNGVTRLVAGDDGEALYSASLDGTVRIWKLDAASSGTAEIVLDQRLREQQTRRKKGKEAEEILNAPGVTTPTLDAAAVLEGHQGWVRALGISRSGDRLISGDDSCLTIVWDLKTRQPVAQWRGHDRVWVTSAALSPDGSRAFTAEYAGRRSSFDVPAAQARLWDAATGEMQLDLLRIWTPKVKDKDRADTYAYGRAWRELMKRGLVSAKFSSDGSLLACAQGGETQQGQILLVDTETGEIVRKLDGHKTGARDVCFSQDGKYVLSSGRDTALRIWQVSDGKEVAALGEGRGGQFKDWLDGIAVHVNHAAAADISGCVRIWQLS